MLGNSMLEEILLSGGDTGEMKRKAFIALTKDLIKFIHHDSEYLELMSEIKDAERLKSELLKRKDTIHQERVQRAVLESKLSGVYTEVKELKDANIKLKQTVAELELAPIRSQRKSENLKNLVNEMRLEIKRLQPKDEALEASVELEELSGADTAPSFRMFSMKVAIFGGHRAGNASQFPNIKAMTGDENSDDFGPIIKNSDIAVVLTQHIGHVSMWSIKAFCAVYNKPALFTKHINIPVILQEAEKLLK